MRKEHRGLRLGQKVKYIHVVRTDKGNARETRSQKGTVTGLYEHIFQVEWDNHRWKECFPYSLMESTRGERIQAL